MDTQRTDERTGDGMTFGTPAERERQRQAQEREEARRATRERLAWLDAAGQAALEDTERREARPE